MATPAKPPPTDPTPSAEWPNLSEVVSPVAKPQLDPSLPPLIGVKRPGAAEPTSAVPPPAVKKDTKAPVWTEESICFPQPPPARRGIGRRTGCGIGACLAFREQRLPVRQFPWTNSPIPDQGSDRRGRHGPGLQGGRHLPSAASRTQGDEAARLQRRGGVETI